MNPSHCRLAADSLKRFEFAEQEPQQPSVEPGLEQFLKDTSLSGDATEEEIEFLKALKFRGKQPAPSYYYGELQNLRDPLHFPACSATRRIRLIEAVRGPLGSKGMPHGRNF